MTEEKPLTRKEAVELLRTEDGVLRWNARRDIHPMPNLSGANLTRANLSGALYTISTIFPAAFDPKARGMVRAD